MFKPSGNALPRMSLLIATFSLAACGGGGSSSDDGNNSEPGTTPEPETTAVDPGVFETTVTYAAGGGDNAFTLLSPSGKYATIITSKQSPDGTFGTLTFADDGTVSGTGNNVFLDGETWDSEDGSLEGNVVSSQEFIATFTAPDSSSEITLVRDTEFSDLGVTMEDLSGSYSMDRRTEDGEGGYSSGVLTNVTIDSGGTVTGSDTVVGSDPDKACVINGSVTIPDATYNSFEGTLNLDNCSDIDGGATGLQRDGDYQIVGAYEPATNDIVFAGTNGTVVALFISD